MDLSIKGLALAFGVTWGGGMLLLGLVAALGWGRPAVELIGSVYLGFTPTVPGSVIGGVWGFVDGAVGGLVIAWLYNRLR
jgi:hypothetical protein